MSTIRCGRYSTFLATYSAHQPVCAISTCIVPDESSVIAVLHNQDKILIPTYLRFCCKYVDNSMCLILHICCQILCTPAIFSLYQLFPCVIGTVRRPSIFSRQGAADRYLHPHQTKGPTIDLDFLSNSRWSLSSCTPNFLNVFD